jgi:hypothetical protein
MDYLSVVLLAVAVGATGALGIFAAYDLGFERGRRSGEQEERRRWVSKKLSVDTWWQRGGRL